MQPDHITTDTPMQDAEVRALLERITPTPDLAKRMFAQNPGLASVDTTEGVMRRDGTFVDEFHEFDGSLPHLKPASTEPPADNESHANMSITGVARPGEAPSWVSPGREAEWLASQGR